MDRVIIAPDNDKPFYFSVNHSPSFMDEITAQEKGAASFTQGQQLLANHIPVIFHSVLFGYEDATRDLLGEGADAITPYIIQRMIPMLAREGIEIVDKNGSVVENMARLVRYFNSPGLIDGFAISKEPDGAYRVEMQRCAFACSGVHDEAKPGTKCPYSLIVAALLSVSEIEHGKPGFTVSSCSFTKLGISAKIRPTITALPL